MKADAPHTPPDRGAPAAGAAQSLLKVAGTILVVIAIAYNEIVVSMAASAVLYVLPNIFVGPNPSDIRKMQVIVLVAGVVLLGLSRVAGSSGRLGALLRRPIMEKLLLAFLAVAVPLTAIELALRPFAPSLSKETSLFVRDDALGWRMRPNVNEMWSGVPIQTNSKGLRGPDVPYEKPAGTFRILYLGDSVTFGYRIERAADTFAAITGRALSAGPANVETINSGVGGYSPWQELAYLEAEGFRYDPDLVVLSFVLNDVTEKFNLNRFGGEQIGYQLTQSYHSLLDRIMTGSGLGYQIRHVSRKLQARRRFGANPQLGAVRQQRLDVQTLIEHPDQKNIRIAWDVTLENMQKIVDQCGERGVPLLIVAFPFTIQFEDIERNSAPQRRLAEFASRNNVPMLDMLTPLAEYAAARGMAPADLFLDDDHLTVEGHRAAAEIIAGEIRRLGFLD